MTKEIRGGEICSKNGCGYHDHTGLGVTQGKGHTIEEYQKNPRKLKKTCGGGVHCTNSLCRALKELPPVLYCLSQKCPNYPCSLAYAHFRHTNKEPVTCFEEMKHKNSLTPCQKILLKVYHQEQEREQERKRKRKIYSLCLALFTGLMLVTFIVFICIKQFKNSIHLIDKK